MTLPAYGENISALIARQLQNRDVQRGAVRGVAETPGRTLSALEVIKNLLTMPYEGDMPPSVQETTYQPPNAAEQLAPTYGPQLSNYLGDKTGIPHYDSGPGAVAQEMTGSLGPSLALGGPMVGTGSGLATMLGAGAGGAGASEALRQRGVGGLGQFLGDIGTDTLLSGISGPAALAAVPGAIVRGAGKKAVKKVPKQVAEAMRATRFTEVPAHLFVEARDLARKGSKGGFLSDTSAEDLSKAGTRTFLSEDGNVGYAIDPAGDVQGVFNKAGKEGEKARQNAGKFAVIDAIRNGGKKLDAFEGHLTKDLYPLFGFTEDQRFKWAKEHAPKDWDYQKYGEPDVVFMSRKPGVEPMRQEDIPQTLDRTAMQTRYPRVGLPAVGIDKKSGKLFMEKGASKEAEEVMALRKQISKDIQAGNYEPFFPVDKRYDVNPANYPKPEMTTKTLPKKQDTIDRWRKGIDTPEARQRLKTAYETGLSEMSKNWYMLGQLEDQYVQRLGPELGRQRFLEHIEGIAATTGGNDPTSNWLMARYAAFEKAKRKKLPEVGGIMPSPIGGRYAGSNAETFNKLIFDKLGIGPADNPKRYDFTRNFLGHVDSGTIDEQMTRLITPEVTISKARTKAQIAAGKRAGKKTYKKLLAPEGDTYGIYQDIIRETAKELGVDPRMLQEVAWAGAKKSEGKPMIQHINESIERTSKITGLSPQEVVNGWIDEKLPAFGFAGGAGIGAVGATRRDQKKGK